ncbi:MAG: LytTR family DNA-binding domain-containing protein [Lachnospiraceae bacterium]|nr:LytTR family DNA-binding domain-containing protein [Lachnospiraceae bacterium]
MTINIAIVEDENIFAKQLKEILEQWSKQLNCLVCIDYFKDTKLFLLNDFDNYDVAFLDIELNDTMDGLELAQLMREELYQGSIVFLTNYKEYVFQGYDVQALNYLLKPVKAEDIIKCMNIVYKLTRENAYVFNGNIESIKIPYSKILYFSSSNHYIDIYTTETTYSHRGKLADMKCHLPYNFIQCHRSILVNINHVEKIFKTDLVLVNGCTLPISGTYLEQIRTAFLSIIL